MLAKCYLQYPRNVSLMLFWRSDKPARPDSQRGRTTLEPRSAEVLFVACEILIAFGGVMAGLVPAIPIIRHCAIPHPTLPRLRGRVGWGDGTSPAMTPRVLLLL